MRQTPEFGSIRDELSKGDKKDKIKLRSDIEPEFDAERSLGVREHLANFRNSIQDFLEEQNKAEPSEDIKERTKFLKEVVSPERMKEYAGIMRELKKPTLVTENHPQREFVDINSDANGEMIDGWVDNLIADIENKKGDEFSDEDFDRLRATSWLYFDSVGSVMNAKSIAIDVKEMMMADKFEEKAGDKQGEMKNKMVKNVGERYPFRPIEVKSMVDMVVGPEINVFSTIGKLWNQYNVGEHKKDIAKVGIGYGVTEFLRSLSPYLMKDLVTKQGAFHGEFFVLSQLVEFAAQKVHTETSISLETFSLEIKKKVNKRIAESLFFHEFEFIHDKSLGELYSAMGRGKDATSNLLNRTVDSFAPTAFGITTSLAMLTSISPLLAGIGGAGIPVMAWIARKQNRKMQDLYRGEIKEGEKAAEKINTVKSGFEDARTSPDIISIREDTEKQLNLKDEISKQRLTKYLRNQFSRSIPDKIASVVSLAVGIAMEKAGGISGGGRSDKFYVQSQDDDAFTEFS